MPTQEQLDAIKLYANIMAEIKIRIAAIDAGTGGKVALSSPFIREFSFLQIRMICELVALGCLVAHGDIKTPKSKALTKEWSADAIIKALADLHPDFFPIAVREQIAEPLGSVGYHRHIEPVRPPVMTKAEFITLYGICGNVLHKGNLRKLLKEKMPVQVSFPEITAKAQKFVDLLSLHTVHMLGGSTFFICAMNSTAIPDGVQVAIAESGQPPPAVILAAAASDAKKKR